MKAIIQESFTRDEAIKLDKKGVVCVTPQNFSSMNWEGVEVSGIDYYVKKAVSLGAKSEKKKPGPKPKAE